MAVKLLPGFQTLTEFGQYHGDCGWCALLGVLHSLNPAAYPLSLDELNHLTTDAIAHGHADASLSGGVNIPNLSAELDRLGIAHTTVGYDAFTLDKLHADLKAAAGVHGVIVEVAKGGALPGDEPAVNFHYPSCGGVDTGPAGDGIGGAYLWCDGDNRASGAAPGAPLRYTWAQVVAAQPIGYITITQEAAAMALTIERDGAGNVTGAHDEHGAHIGAGFALAAQRGNLTGQDIALPEYQESGVELAIIGQTLMTYTPGHDVQAFTGSDLCAAFLSVLNGRAGAMQQVADLHAQNEALQTELANQKPAPAPQPQPVTVAQALDTLRDFFSGKVAA